MTEAPKLGLVGVRLASQVLEVSEDELKVDSTIPPEHAAEFFNLLTAEAGEPANVCGPSLREFSIMAFAMQATIPADRRLPMFQ